jgi:ligand-binding sensor domain-containing protein/signal transduction histidine kinase/DNA-binding response OmpR family regulator
MNFYVKKIFVFCVFFWPLLGRAQKVSFDHFSVENGLSQNSVLSIAQDKRGFMWFGTRYALNKFDTRRFKVYKGGSKGTKWLSSDEYIRALLVDRGNVLWVGSINGLNRYNEETDSFEQILSTPASTSISANLINYIFEDSFGRIWIATNNGLNLLTDKKKNRFKRYFYKPESQQQTAVTAIAQDKKGIFWIATSNGLISFSLSKGKICTYRHKDVDAIVNSVSDNFIAALLTDKNNAVWVGTKKTGLIRLDEQGTVTSFVHNTDRSSISSNDVRKMIVATDGKLWIGTLNGLNCYDPERNTFTLFQHDPDDPESLSQNSIYDVFQDRQGNLWVGTYYGGVNVFYSNQTAFRIYRNSRHVNSISSDVISAMIEDSNHNYWIGTEAEGLNFLDKKTGEFTVYRNNYKDPASISSNLVKAIFQDKNGNIWVGTHQGGLNLFNPVSRRFKRYTHDAHNHSSISSNDVSRLLQDSHDRFWVGTDRGLNLFDPKSKTFRFWPLKPDAPAICCIYEDKRGNVWVGTFGGLFCLFAGARDFSTITNGNINCVGEDVNGNIWFSKYHGGLQCLNTKTNRITTFTSQDGLPSDNVLGILTDKAGTLWLSTDNGLVNYNFKSFKNYNTRDGLPGNEFNYNSFLRDSEGRLFFGSYTGLVSFDPTRVTQNAVAPPIVFTGLRLFNKSVIPGENSLLKKDMCATDHITLRYDQNVFAVDFAALNYINPSKNRYAYMLAGFEKNWNHVDVPAASYTNLSPGHYTLLVKGTNNDGVWSSKAASLQITVLPPLWRTWWAYVLYTLFGGCIIYGFNRLLIMRALLDKEKEVHQMKLNFFTNISHEIRTPLTLITGPLEKIISEHKEDSALNTQIISVKNNADRLMRLITELLDFRKAESGNLKLQVSNSNIISFVYEIFLAYQNMALSRNITYTFDAQQDDVNVYFDKEQLEKVVFNLLSNAFKFTADHGCITVKITLTGNEVAIAIEDNGLGIPLESQSKIFTNFYQATNADGVHGSGIGLALSKSIATLHHGNLSFESEPAKKGQNGRTVFTIVLQLGKAHFSGQELIGDHQSGEDPVYYRLESQINDMLNRPDTATTLAEKEATLLIVEDNDEVRAFIRSSLEQQYNILESSNGADGWQIAAETLPDLIISDVMMPEMDGFELCRKIKTDSRTSHIPIILLTARAAYIHHVTGLETGADAYITKPFSVKLLQLNVRNLLQARNVMREKFARTLMLEPQNVAINSTDEIFITKVLRYIEEHLTNPDFGVPMLASEVGMSQPVLYKKIRALTDLSVNDFIKSIRLKKAVQLLEQRQLTIYEIAYAVGFSDRKYFSQEFKKYYGKTPTEYLAEMPDEQTKNKG